MMGNHQPMEGTHDLQFPFSIMELVMLDSTDMR